MYFLRQNSIFPNEVIQFISISNFLNKKTNYIKKNNFKYVHFIANNVVGFFLRYVLIRPIYRLGI